MGRTNPKPQPQTPNEIRQEELIASLRERVRQLEEDQAKTRKLNELLEHRERRLRVWALGIETPQGQRIHFAAFVNRKVYHGANFSQLIIRLRALGYLIKNRAFKENPPADDGELVDGEIQRLLPIEDIRDMTIPDGIPFELQAELGDSTGEKQAA